MHRAQAFRIGVSLNQCEYIWIFVCFTSIRINHVNVLMMCHWFLWKKFKSKFSYDHLFIVMVHLPLNKVVIQHIYLGFNVYCTIFQLFVDSNTLDNEESIGGQEQQSVYEFLNNLTFILFKQNHLFHYILSNNSMARQFPPLCQDFRNILNTSKKTKHELCNHKGRNSRHGY